ncbi:type I-C CRISPR-associated protein Cas8c/Csd1 [Sporanaerobium hydrogeniformans]|uniref:Type I-C CRISPR-associated protein Cas8c/Csd1 n=1 Tax=Sporanaerobium hydrogeniformans TaxID=3072179 RepID=A0AC61DG21_9FIRM|nr:type I-C CRISPR-associated protein Cas8c/Csd1 [Sporanaerobium hydrogeniformans]PHV71527.1 type I-C CRISPR-associated protein Cas8c/Csd1 [Sporanaerobium hydrogeniformans]
MILQALEECYDIMVQDKHFEVAPFGYSKVLCNFAIVIDEEGNFKTILDLREGKKGQFHTVPLQDGRSSGIKPYLLCDKSKYIVGKEADSKGKLVQYQAYLEAMYEKHQQVFSDFKNKGIQAVEKFLMRVFEGEELLIPPSHDCYKGSLMIFKLEGEEGYIHENLEVRDYWEKYSNSAENSDKEKVIGQCLISGKDNVKIADKHTLIKGVMGAQAAGASLSSINMSSAESYGVQKAYNAPISEETMFKYTTALNSLIASNKNRLIIGDTTCVFWTEKEIAGNSVDVLMGLFSGVQLEEKKELQMEHNEVEHTKNILERVLMGLNIGAEILEREEDTKVYILGLSPNMARLSIRFWYQDTFGHFAEKMKLHYEDMDLVKSDKAKNIVAIRDILKSMAVQGKNENIPKVTQNALFTAITEGSTYPQGVYTNLLIRIKAEAGDEWCINATRVSYIKAFLKRKYRINQLMEKEGELTVALNENSISTAYHLGRLFAVLEKLQQDAGNTGLRERYFASAATNPKVVFPAILKLAQSHIAKVSKSDGSYYMDKLCQDILEKIEEFPTSLSLDDQGLFILGYYHQKQYIYTKKENR